MNIKKKIKTILRLEGISKHQLSDEPLINIDYRGMIKLNITNNDLTSLEFLSYPIFEKKLKRLNCAHNKLSELELSNLPKLEVLICSFNKLTKLELSNLPKLELLICSFNNLTKLDLSELQNLEHLHYLGNANLSEENIEW